MSVKHLLRYIAGVKINTNFLLLYPMTLVHDRLPELKDSLGTSLVVQWLKILLPMQRMRLNPCWGN